MLSDQDLTAAIGSTAYGPDGEPIGTVEHFFVDDRTGAPTWVAVRTGLFGTRHSIVPILDAAFADGALRVPVDRNAVHGAPTVGDTEHLGPVEEEQLRRHYGLGGPETAAAPAGERGGPADERPTADAADAAMIRSEERLRVSTEQVAAKRVRVVKYVVTEEVQVTVPLRREEIRIEEIPLDAGDDERGDSLVTEADLEAAGQPMAGRGAPGDREAGPGREPLADRATTGTTAGAGELPESIVLHREEPVFSVRVVPAERVWLRTEAETGHERVGAQLRRERVDVVETPAPRAEEPERR